VAEDGESARAAFTRHSPDLVLLDIWMPDVDGITLLREWSSGGALECPVVVMSGHGTVETAIEATRLGAHDFVQKPISLAKLLSIVSRALESGSARSKPASSTRLQSSEPIGSSAVMQLLRSKAEQAAQHELPVLITGEKGSGRANLARHIHEKSGREGPFTELDPCELAPETSREYLLGSDETKQQASSARPAVAPFSFRNCRRFRTMPCKSFTRPSVPATPPRVAIATTWVSDWWPAAVSICRSAHRKTRPCSKCITG
jgi:DNA-binding NtrC family response regulator